MCRGRYNTDAENLVNYPALVVIPNGSPLYTDISSNTGDDLRFYDSNETTELAYEIEVFTKAGDSFIWVRVTQIDASSNADYIWMYYGNSTLAAKSNGPSVFPPSEYNIVVHFSKDASGNPASIAYGNYTAGNEPTLYDSTGQYPLTWKFAATGGAVPTGTEGFQTTTGMIGTGVQGAAKKTVFMSEMNTTMAFATGTYSAFIYYQPIGGPDSFRTFIHNQGIRMQRRE